jgi:hypothetical protein
MSFCILVTRGQHNETDHRSYHPLILGALCCESRGCVRNLWELRNHSCHDGLAQLAEVASRVSHAVLLNL